jgi:hypothetical protein
MYMEFQMVKKKRTSAFQQRPDTTTSARFTNIKEPKASKRFKIGDRVAWDDGENLILGKVESFDLDDCAVVVLLETGMRTVWANVSARLRKIQSPIEFDSNKSVAEITPIGEPVDSYEELTMDYEKHQEEEHTQPVERVDFFDTLVRDEDWKK